MIKEYGVDTAILNSTESFYFISSFFSIEKWRLIRKFPENWELKVRQSFRDVKPKEKLRLIDQLQKLSKHLIHCNYSKGIINYTYDEQQLWIINAEKYHLLYPFHVKITNKNPNANNLVCKEEELDENHPLMTNQNDYAVRRDAVTMAQCVSPILSNAKQIHFVDRYFENGAIADKFLRPLKEFLNTIFSRSNHAALPITRIVYHTADKTLTANLMHKLNTEIKPLLKNGVSLEIIRWPFDDLHNRYILTDIGGVSFQEGLDDDNLGNGRAFDDINPIAASACLQKSANNSPTPYMLKVFDPTKDIKI